MIGEHGGAQRIPCLPAAAAACLVAAAFKRAKPSLLILLPSPCAHRHTGLLLTCHARVLCPAPQEVGVHVIAPAAALRADPLPGAVAAFTLREAAAALGAGGVALPEGAGRFVVAVDGTESEAEVASLRVRAGS